MFVSLVLSSFSSVSFANISVGTNLKFGWQMEELNLYNICFFILKVGFVW